VYARQDQRWAYAMREAGGHAAEQAGRQAARKKGRHAGRRTGRRRKKGAGRPESVMRLFGMRRKTKGMVMSGRRQ
jgi:hypothetical protein